jgi:hypothetical protein
MSLVLGPVHHWMYKKIQTTEARESFIVNAFKEKYGQSADEILNNVYEKYPPSNPDTPLEELLEGVAIHQGIQELIIKAETREGATIAAFCEKHGDEAKELAIKAAHDCGVECGKAAAQENSEIGCTASRAFELLSGSFCDGMPCDRGAQVTDESDACTTWDHTDCVHESYWKDAGASFETMCELITSWIAGFGEGVNPQIKHTRGKAIAFGDSECISTYEISE